MMFLQNMTVDDVYRLNDEDLVLLSVADDFSQVIENFALHADLRGFFVVDDAKCFLGVISRTDQLDWAQAKLAPVLLDPLASSDKTIRLSNLIGATTVGDVLRQDTKQASVLGSDSLTHALRLMIKADLIILPVLDKSQQIIGSLTLSELLHQLLIKS